jgi:hypothetical protein
MNNHAKRRGIGNARVCRVECRGRLAVAVDLAGRAGDSRSYSADVGTSFVDYRGCGFWTRDAALETVLGLVICELEPLSEADAGLSGVLDSWTLQATVGFTGCVSPDLDANLADPRARPLVTTALRRILDRLPAEGLVAAAGVGLTTRAERVTDGGPWRCPSALATWVTEVSKALLDLIEGDLPSLPVDRWFVDGFGRHQIPRAGHDVKSV